MIARQAALLLLTLAAGCGAAVRSGEPGPGPGAGSSSGSGSDPGSGSGVHEARSGLSRNPSPGAPEADVARVVAGNNAFALQLHQRLVEPGANLMTSPYSVSAALAMLWPGARGDTASQLASALQFTLPAPQFHAAFNALDLAVPEPLPSCASDAAAVTLHVTNAAWLQRGFSFSPAYLDTLAVNYGAGLGVLDFENAPDAARKTINAAVARATEQRIPELLPRGSIDALVKLVLTNAVYFKGNWAQPFSPDRTAPGTFRLLDGSEVAVPLMHGWLETRGAVQPAYDAVELHYRCSRYAMTVIAPKAGTFEAFERALDVAALEAVDAAMTDAAVTLVMPRFGFRWGTKSLKPALEALGMRDAFVEDLADLTGMSDRRPLYVHDVLQQTFVAVDEAGTEAAAATAVITSSSSGGMPPPRPQLTVTLDRPFLFLVRNTATGQILFLGRVVNPR